MATIGRRVGGIGGMLFAAAVVTALAIKEKRIPSAIGCAVITGFSILGGKVVGWVYDSTTDPDAMESDGITADALPRDSGSEPASQ